MLLWQNQKHVFLIISFCIIAIAKSHNNGIQDEDSTHGRYVVFFDNIRKIIFLTSISPADWIVQTGAPGSDRGSDLFSCGAISPTFSLQCLQNCCDISNVFTAMPPTFSLQCLQNCCDIFNILTAMSPTFFIFLLPWCDLSKYESAFPILSEPVKFSQSRKYLNTFQ